VEPLLMATDTAFDPPARNEPPELAFRDLLRAYPASILQGILSRLENREVPANRSEALASTILEHFRETPNLSRILEDLQPGALRALGLFAVCEVDRWPLPSLERSLRMLCEDTQGAIEELRDKGLLVMEVDSEELKRQPKGSLLAALPGSPDLPIHMRTLPVVRSSVRMVRSDVESLEVTTSVRQVRETDGLEPILRLAALWQRVVDQPLRKTQQGTLFKRDRERLDEEPTISGPIADEPMPIPEIVDLWLSLAERVGLLYPEDGSDRILAASADYWLENGVHLPQMLATQWLALGVEGGGGLASSGAADGRAALLLLLASLPEDSWVPLQSLATVVAALDPPRSTPEPSVAVKAGTVRRKEDGKRGRGPLAWLEATLLGPAYQLGLVRVAESVPDGGRVVQVSPLGRYVLRLGPPAATKPAFDQFLFVQPNFEMIAYRQGLTPAIIGQLSRFAWWLKLGAALELKLTPESIYRGLEGGLTTQKIIDRLNKHSVRPLPPAVSDALATWSGRRDRVTYHPSATLMEFPTVEALEQALEAWPATEGHASPVRISERLLLVEEESTIPFARFRLAGSRDYRRPPEVCVEVETDGVTLTLDTGRSDLFVEAELQRIAEELPTHTRATNPGSLRRSYRLTPNSVRKAIEEGLAPAALDRWFRDRTGAAMPPATRLLAGFHGQADSPLRAIRSLVVLTPSEAILDGLFQHPETRDLLADRLGPCAVRVRDFHLDRLREAADRLGLAMEPVEEP
jgi:hypothetical protein